MRTRSNAPGPRRLLRFSACFAAFSVILGFAGSARGQTASTGALSGLTPDPASAVLPGVSICLAKLDGPQKPCETSDAGGRFGFLFLTPGDYALVATKPGSGP